MATPMAISVNDVLFLVEEGKFVKDGVPALCTCIQGDISVCVIAIEFAKAYSGKHL